MIEHFVSDFVSDSFRVDMFEYLTITISIFQVVYIDASAEIRDSESIISVIFTRKKCWRLHA